MRVKVKSMGVFKEFFGAGVEVEISDPPYTVGRLLAILTERHGVDFAHMAIPPTGEDHMVALLLRGRHIGIHGGLETVLADDDELCFLVMVSGG